MRLSLSLSLTAIFVLAVYLLVDLSSLAAWAVEAQRGFQNQMALAVRALKAGDTGAYLALFSATAAYGFVHALGPGHGKYLVGGVGLGTKISTLRLVGLAAASSVAQSMWAIIIVYGGFSVLEITAHQMTKLAEDFLAPVSYAAIATVGLVIVWRGIKALRRVSDHAHSHDHDHDHDHCNCHSHGPSPEEAAQVTSLRAAAGLILSIAIRPCTGAIFLLVIAWQMDIRLAGALAVLVMGLGTAGLTSLVAVSSVAARSLTFASTGRFNKLRFAVPALQVITGTFVMILSLGLLGQRV